MTALKLFLYILIGAFVQMTIAAAVVMVRRWRDYQFLQKRMAGLEVDPPEGPSLKDVMADGLGVDTGGSWKGERAFRVVERAPESPDGNICSFYLEPEDGGPLADFKPGQFLTFHLDLDDLETGVAKAITRCYSLSDAPELATPGPARGNGRYRVSIKRVPAPPTPPGQPELPPGLSSNHFHDRVHEGDVLKVKAPSGHFYLERGHDPVVLIAGGIGITPMISMLNDTLAHDPDHSGEGREVWLFYGVRNSREHAMKMHLERLADRHANFHLHVCYSQPLAEDVKGGDYQHAGRIDVSLLRQTLSFQVYDFYICGPRPMMESLVPALDDWGVPDQHIHYEAFGPASIPRPKRKKAAAEAGPQTEPEAEEQAQGPVSVTFSKSGKTVVWDGGADTLLDFAEEHGVEIPSGCRAGGCGTCQTTIVSGEVSYTHTPDFDPEPGACLACAARPKTDLTVEA